MPASISLRSSLLAVAGRAERTHDFRLSDHLVFLLERPPLLRQPGTLHFCKRSYFTWKTAGCQRPLPGFGIKLFSSRKGKPSRVFRVDSPALHIIPLFRRLAHENVFRAARRPRRSPKSARLSIASSSAVAPFWARPAASASPCIVIQRPAAPFAAGLIEVFCSMASTGRRSPRP